MKSFLATVAIALALLAIGAGSKSVISNSSPFGSLTTTYKNSNADTLIFYRPAGMTAGSFAAHFSDSVSVSLVKVRRQVDGEWLALQTGDTLTAFTNFLDTTTVGILGTSANPSSAVVGTLTIAPLPEAYAFIVNYASSLNGVTNNTVRYSVNWTRSQ